MQLSLFSQPQATVDGVKPPRPPRPPSWMDEIQPHEHELQARMRHVLTFWTPKSEEEWLAWAPHLTGPLPERWERYRDSFGA